MAVQERAGLSSAGVTIAIPNWNHELLLPRAIDSAMQTIALLRKSGVLGEVLVIDEASRDGSALLLRQLEAMYYQEGLRVLSLADTRSLGCSRNQALLNARYRYVAFLDADNELIPANFPSFLLALEQTGAAVVYGNLLVRTPASRCAMSLLSNESVQARLFHANYIDALALADRQQLVDVGGYDTSYRAMEDHEMWLHLAVNGRRIVFVPIVFGYYYVLPNSMQAEQHGDRTEGAVRRIQRVYDQIRARNHCPFNTDKLRYHPTLGYF